MQKTKIKPVPELLTQEEWRSRIIDYAMKYGWGKASDEIRNILIRECGKRHRAARKAAKLATAKNQKPISSHAPPSAGRMVSSITGAYKHGKTT